MPRKPTNDQPVPQSANNRVPPIRPPAPPVTKAQPPEEQRPKIDPALLKRPQGKRPDPPPAPPPVSAGPVDRVIELAFNPTRDKIREVTIIDRMQGRLLPQLDLIMIAWQNIIEVATYRQDSAKYKAIYGRDMPVSPNLIDEYMYRVAQWQKSVAGKNLERATDIALAETETRGDEDVEGGGDAWKE